MCWCWGCGSIKGWGKPPSDPPLSHMSNLLMFMCGVLVRTSLNAGINRRNLYTTPKNDPPDTPGQTSPSAFSTRDIVLQCHTIPYTDVDATAPRGNVFKKKSRRQERLPELRWRAYPRRLLLDFLIMKVRQVVLFVSHACFLFLDKLPSPTATEPEMRLHSSWRTVRRKIKWYF